ncbi:MAG: hypothetical protein ACK5WB_09435 [Phycisphaerales bacterium]|jgi:hypothetical protein|nr:hypothetical protein [Phycisphaeraceae bacterium]
MRRQRRYYEELRSIVEELGGKMSYVRCGRPPPGSWLAWLPGYTEKFFECNGRGFPELDSLYVPKISHPTSWEH